MQKFIEIKRHFSIGEMSQEDPEVKIWMGQSFRAVGPYNDKTGKAVATGLTFTEQRLLLPEVLGIEASDKDFRKVVTNFYNGFITPIPKEGRKLIISLENDAEELSETNPPQNIMDYITYRHVTGHPEVAKDKAEAERNIFKKFYIVDPDGVTQEAVRLNKLEDEAYTLYMHYKDDNIKVDQLLTMLGVNIRNMKREDKVLKLKSAAQKNASLNDAEQKEVLDNFIKVCKDKDLEYKYLIQEMIGAQYLQRVGNNIIYAESGKKVGDNMEDAVLYFKNPKNSRDLNLLKAQYEQKLRKGKEYLPKDNPEETSKAD